MKRPWPDYTDELLAWARENAPENAPVALHVGSEAMDGLKAAIAGEAIPLPGAPNGVDRQILMLTGLPIILRADWPVNLVVVMDGRGRAWSTSVINYTAA